jgi:uncharacterized protein (DUF1800 family)
VRCPAVRPRPFSRHRPPAATRRGAEDDGRARAGTEGEIAIDPCAAQGAAFIARTLISSRKRPSPHVSDVATAFLESGWSIKAAVRAILTHPEFTDPAVVRSQFKEPIEQFIAPIRALGGMTGGEALIDWSYDAGQLVYYPPSVFSFYPPGHKDALVNTATVFIRDRMADESCGARNTLLTRRSSARRSSDRRPDGRLRPTPARLVSRTCRALIDYGGR